MEDNWSQQADEIEALSSIFCDQFKLDDAVEKKYSILITDGDGNSQFPITLQVTFPPDYPSDSPPMYQLNAPWLRGEEKMRLSSSLDEIYCDNIGQCIVYMWVEKIKEFLHTMTDALNNSKFEHQSTKVDHTESEIQLDTKDGEGEGEADNYYDDEYGFNPELHAYKAHTHAFPEEGDGNEHDGITLPPIHHGEFVKDRKSVFQGHLAPITHRKQVTMVLDKLKENKKIAQATHNIIAYRIECGRDSFATGCEDDGEIHAGSRMLHLLNIVDARNVLVIVTRWYGGVHLGPDRFKHINNCTRELLEAHGYIKEKATDKKGPKSRSGQESQTASQSQKTRHGQRHGKKGR